MSVNNKNYFKKFTPLNTAEYISCAAMSKNKLKPLLKLVQYIFIF